MEKSITIREGQLKDLPDVLALVQELAVFEKEPDAVSCTLEEYQNNFNRGIFEFLVAESNKKIIGTAIFYFGFSTWKGKMLFLEDFIISHKYRKQGIGKKIFDQLIQYAQDTGCVMIKWQVLDWNVKAQNFYSKYNAVIERNWWNGKFFIH